MDFSQFWPIFWSVIGTIATALASWLASRIIVLLNNKIKDAKAAKFFTTIITIITSAVKTTTQEFVSVMKDEGTFTQKAQKEIKEKTYNIIINQLSSELKDYITENFGDLREWIMNQIEAVICDLKIKN